MRWGRSPHPPSGRHDGAGGDRGGGAGLFDRGFAPRGVSSQPASQAYELGDGVLGFVRVSAVVLRLRSAVLSDPRGGAWVCLSDAR
jgi:hypothetical protein